MNRIFKNNSLFTNNDDNNEEDDNNNEEYIFENQNEKRNEDIALQINDKNAREYTTLESSTSAQNASQTETSTTTQFVTIPTRIVSPRPNTQDPQSYLDTYSGHGNKFKRKRSNFNFEWTKFEFSKNRNKFESLCSNFEQTAEV